MRVRMTMRSFLALLALWCWAAGPALAGARVALVIGNGAYAHVSGLLNPAHDAGDMAWGFR